MSEEKVQCTYCGKILEKGICWHCMFNACTPLVNPSISDDEVNWRLHKTFGYRCWHAQIKQDGTCLCGEKHTASNTSVLNHDYYRMQDWKTVAPDYCNDPIRVLREMREREDWPEFRDSIGGWKTPYEVVRVDLILDNPRKLARMALEWVEGRK